MLFSTVIKIPKLVLRYMFYEFFWERGKFTASHNSAMNLIPKTCRDEGAYAKDVAYNGKGSEEDYSTKLLLDFYSQPLKRVPLVFVLGGALRSRGSFVKFWGGSSKSIWDRLHLFRIWMQCILATTFCPFLLSMEDQPLSYRPTLALTNLFHCTLTPTSIIDTNCYYLPILLNANIF